jgi:hypothetical protein
MWAGDGGSVTAKTFLDSRPNSVLNRPLFELLEQIERNLDSRYEHRPRSTRSILDRGPGAANSPVLR